MASARWKSRIVGEANVDPRTLIPNPQNWRIHPRTQQRAMSGTLDTLGWIQRVVVNKRTGHIVDGHLRIEMAMENKECSVPVCYVDLSEDEERLALATFDPLSAMAETDARMFAALTMNLTTENDALDALLHGEAAQQYAATATDQSKSIAERYEVLVTLPTEVAQAELLYRLSEEGFACRSLIS